MLTGGVLSLSFLDNDLFYLTWLAFIPLLWSVENASVTQNYLIGLVAGLVSYVNGMYWIVDFIVISKGYSVSKSILLAAVYWLYCAHLIAFLLALFAWLKRHTRLHEFLLFPLIVATFTSSYPMLFSMRLGESQVNFHSALQAIEFTGVHGLDFIIALFNIVVFRLLHERASNHTLTPATTKLPWAIAISLILAWFTYGAIQFPAWQQNTKEWKTLKVGIVQPNEIPTLGKATIYPGYSYAYPPEMEMSERLSGLGAEIVVWPEAQPKGYLNNRNIRRAFQHNVQALGISLVFQDMQQHRNPINGQLLRQTNTAVMIDESGLQHDPYIKIKRIPFGEYVPFTGENSLVKEWVENVFGDFLIETTKGITHQVFTHKNVNIVPLICYETTSPSFVAQAIKNTRQRANSANGSFIVALSNDGWFGSTHQPYQHILPSVLRAVENRLPLVHAANNGPSIIVSPSGKLIFKSDFQKAGGYLAEVPYSQTAQGSFYSKHPKLFDNILHLSMFLVVLFAIGPMLSFRGRADTR